MESKMEFNFSDGDKVIKTILKDANSTSFTNILNSLEVFRQEINDYLSDRIEANGVEVSEEIDDDDDASVSEDEVSQPISPKKRRK